MGVAEMGWIHTGLQYQAFHTLAIFGLAVAMQRRISIWFTGAASLWRSVPFFQRQPLLSGALAFTPVGVRYAGWGVCFLAGWILMLIGAIRLKRKGVVHE
jgi:uncharacterized membrane protein YgdD (TMEM256/DUF423 family)